ncbi:MAG: hypothetical protein WCT27_03650 [Patescibacteria group bacterium]
MAIPSKNPHDDLTVMKQRVFMWSAVFLLLIVGSSILVYFVFVRNGGMFNRGEEVNQIGCGQFTTYTGCYGRRDCLPVDTCGCTTNTERDQRCGKTSTGVCNCFQGGFDHCEKLICTK